LWLLYNFLSFFYTFVTFKFTTEIVFDISATGNLATLTNIPNSATSGFKATLPATIGVNGVAQAYDLVGVTA
jgi:hypothetical protein